MKAVAGLRGRATVVIVEHKAELVLPIADRACVLVNGTIAFDGPAQVLAGDADLQSRLLGVGHEGRTVA
jgi:ABC-type branched-subunit amino acid transport system ATPase component